MPLFLSCNISNEVDITISGVVPVFTADIIYGYTSLEKGLISTFTFL